MIPPEGIRQAHRRRRADMAASLPISTAELQCLKKVVMFAFIGGI